VYRKWLCTSNFNTSINHKFRFFKEKHYNSSFTLLLPQRRVEYTSVSNLCEGQPYIHLTLHFHSTLKKRIYTIITRTTSNSLCFWGSYQLHCIIISPTLFLQNQWHPPLDKLLISSIHYQNFGVLMQYYYTHNTHLHAIRSKFCHLIIIAACSIWHGRNTSKWTVRSSISSGNCPSFSCVINDYWYSINTNNYLIPFLPFTRQTHFLTIGIYRGKTISNSQSKNGKKRTTKLILWKTSKLMVA
jgi:hypothetical protein